MKSQCHSSSLISLAYLNGAYTYAGSGRELGPQSPPPDLSPQAPHLSNWASHGAGSDRVVQQLRKETRPPPPASLCTLTSTKMTLDSTSRHFHAPHLGGMLPLAS